MKVFQKLRSLLSGLLTRCPSDDSDLIELRYLLLYEKLDDASLNDLHNEILGMKLKGCPVTVEALTEKIPDECVGIVECRSGGKLLSRQYLRLREVPAWQKIVVAEWIR